MQKNLLLQEFEDLKRAIILLKSFSAYFKASISSASNLMFTKFPLKPQHCNAATKSPPPLIPPIKGGKVPSPLVGEAPGEGYFHSNTYYICPLLNNPHEDLP